MCVCVRARAFVLVALLIKHSMRMRHLIKQKRNGTANCLRYEKFLEPVGVGGEKAKFYGSELGFTTTFILADRIYILKILCRISQLLYAFYMYHLLRPP
jgi:hypothetical protein